MLLRGAVDATAILVDAIDIQLDDIAPWIALAQHRRGIGIGVSIAELRRDDGAIAHVIVAIGVEKLWLAGTHMTR